MHKKINITNEQYHSLLQIKELMESEVFSTGMDYVDNSILRNVEELVKKYRSYIKYNER